MLTQPNGEWIGGEYVWVHGGAGNEPDFTGWWDYLEDDPPDEPVIVLAERFVAWDPDTVDIPGAGFERQTFTRTYRSVPGDEGIPELEIEDVF